MPLFVFKMAKAKILVCVPAIDILTGPLFCFFFLLTLESGKANVNLHVVTVLSFIGLFLSFQVKSTSFSYKGFYSWFCQSVL